MDGPATTITLSTSGTIGVAESLDAVEAALGERAIVRLTRVVRGHGGWSTQPVVVSSAHVVCVEAAT